MLCLCVTAHAGSQEYTVSRKGSVIGTLTVSGDAQTRDIDYVISDNGRGAKLRSVVTLDEHGAPTSLTVSGVDLLQNPATERLQSDARGLHWASNVDAGSAKRGGFYFPLYDSPEILAMLTRALRTSPADGLALLPSGRATLVTGNEREVQAGALKKKVRLFLVNGVGLSPQPIWLGEDGELFAMFSQAEGAASEVIPQEWATVAPELRAAQAQVIDARDMQLASELTQLPKVPVLISNANVFDTRAQAARSGMSVLLDGNRIAAVDRDGKVAAPSNARHIDAAGRTLLPGLWDMHVHLQSNTDGLLNIANGVTSVRDMGNDLASVVNWRRRFSTAELIGPRLMLAGMIDGKGPTSASGVQISSAQEASRAITMFADNGYDEIKIYSSFPKTLVPEAVAQARARGLRAGGHIPAGLRLDDAVRMGYTDVSHFYFFLLNTFGDDVQAKSNTLARVLVPAEHAASIEPRSPQILASIEAMRGREVTFDATMIVLEQLFLAKHGTPAAYAAPLGDRLPPQLLRQSRFGGLASSQAQQATYAASFDRALQLLKAVYDGGVQIVPGTDGLAGIMLVRELELYVQAGIPAAGVLQMATLGAARMMKRDTDLGSIEPGKLADLILVDGDPSTDISTLRNLDLVVKDGRLFEVDALDRALGIKARTR